jgi:Na+/H+-translocating membrane pyrophosphatase
MYGIAIAALGMLSTMATALTIDGFGPISDNAGGIAEMALGDSNFNATRKVTDVLDAAGNTTAAIGKGFAIGSAALVSLALFSAFVTRSGMTDPATTNILDPLVFSGLLLGSLLPYWFSGMTIKSTGSAANEMCKVADRQIRAFNEFGTPINSDECIEVSTK